MGAARYVRKCGNYADHRIRVLHVAAYNAVAGFMGFGMGVGGVGPRVNIFSVSFFVFYVHFVFSCVHVAVTLHRLTQLSQVLYLSYLVLGWGQVALFLVDESIIGGVTHPQYHSIT